ncbi:hypothetical protein FITA111629_00550 [Filibacter tadaridae]|uniref:Uncharacterized protein n=1 Tax=Filibacter tadaridae TaxID=2483811 RepID=A0A3P5XJS1_9BACL|nr:hypothetical protein [Filibacter tadaridae]VDC29031.1 hypothetical protein FILTAD_01959 [Filibacter tadaridae]
MKEIIIALVSSSITIVITSFFNYHFQLMKEIRNESVKYKTEILKKVYTPVLKVLVASVVPGVGYDGITKETLFEIEGIMKKNYELVDPDLDSIIWALRKEIRWEHYEESSKLFDKEKRLLSHVEHNFNFYRKQLGLPFSKAKIKRSLAEHYR